jgi:hypothetical protein
MDCIVEILRKAVKGMSLEDLRNARDHHLERADQEEAALGDVEYHYSMLIVSVAREEIRERTVTRTYS